MGTGCQRSSVCCARCRRRAATLGLMRWLTPPDCARFVDLVFALQWVATGRHARPGTEDPERRSGAAEHGPRAREPQSGLQSDRRCTRGPSQALWRTVSSPPVRCASDGDAVVTGLPARLEGVIGQRHGDDRIGRMPAPEQIVFPAVQVLGIERVDPRTDDLVPFDGPNVVPEQVGPDTPDQRDALELVVGGERRERPNRGPGAGRVMRGRSLTRVSRGLGVSLAALFAGIVAPRARRKRAPSVATGVRSSKRTRR